MKNGDSQSKILAIASGKGGVGKTNLAVNLAVSISNTGRKVLVFDADLGLANLDVILGLTPRMNIRHVLDDSRSLDEIVIPGPQGISIIPASSGVTELTDLSRARSDQLIFALSEYTAQYDVVIIDAPSGIGSNTLRFSWMADELLLVTTPEPTAITDAYALLKILHRDKTSPKVKLIVNMAEDHGEATRVAKAFSEISNRFLGTTIDCLGTFVFDPCVPLAVRRQQPFVTCFPHSEATKSLKQLTRRLVTPTETVEVNHDEFQFPNRVRRWLTSWHSEEGFGA